LAATAAMLALLPAGEPAEGRGKPGDAPLRAPQRLDDQFHLSPAAILRREPTSPAEPAVAAGDPQCRFDAARRRPGREQTLETKAAQLPPLIAAGRLGRAGPSRDDAVAIEPEKGGGDRRIGLVGLVGRFGSNRHRSTADKRRSWRNRSMARHRGCLNSG